MGKPDFEKTNPDIQLTPEQAEHLEKTVEVRRHMQGIKEAVQTADEDLQNVVAEYGGLVLGDLHFSDLSLVGTEEKTGNRLVIPFKDLDLFKLKPKS